MELSPRAQLYVDYLNNTSWFKSWHLDPQLSADSAKLLSQAKKESQKYQLISYAVSQRLHKLNDPDALQVLSYLCKDLPKCNAPTLKTCCLLTILKNNSYIGNNKTSEIKEQLDLLNTDYEIIANDITYSFFKFFRTNIDVLDAYLLREFGSIATATQVRTFLQQSAQYNWEYWLYRFSMNTFLRQRFGINFKANQVIYYAIDNDDTDLALQTLTDCTPQDIQMLDNPPVRGGWPCSQTSLQLALKKNNMPVARALMKAGVSPIRSLKNVLALMQEYNIDYADGHWYSIKDKEKKLLV